MNLVFSTTGFQGFNSYNFTINKENLKESFVIPDSKLSSVLVDLCFHLVQANEIEPILQKIYNNLEVGGILRINCLDIYELSQKVHRREIDEHSANNILYGFGQQNSLSTLFFISVCTKLGFKKKSVTFESILAKMEFIK